MWQWSDMVDATAKLLLCKMQISGQAVKHLLNGK